VKASRVRHLGQQVDRLPLRRRQARRIRQLLRRLDVGTRIVAGEAPVAQPEHRQQVDDALAALLLAEPAARIGPVEQFQQVGSAA
jgi:hypothetical protein